MQEKKLFSVPVYYVVGAPVCISDLSKKEKECFRANMTSSEIYQSFPKQDEEIWLFRDKAQAFEYARSKRIHCMKSSHPGFIYKQPAVFTVILQGIVDNKWIKTELMINGSKIGTHPDYIERKIPISYAKISSNQVKPQSWEVNFYFEQHTRVYGPFTNPTTPSAPNTSPSCVLL